MALRTPELLDTKTYAFAKVRQMMADQGGGIQEGVVNAGDYLVTQRGAGANMSVDVAAGQAWIQGDDVAYQGLYHMTNDATINAAVSAAHATLPRLDQIVARIYDSTVTGVSDTPTIEVIAGTATSGATLDNRTGAASLPNGAMRIADVLVPAAAGSIVTANIRDRRPWARGFFFRGSMAAVQPPLALAVDTAFNTRLEGNPGHFFEVSITGLVQSNTASDYVQLQLQLDGVATNQDQYTTCIVANRPQTVTALWRPSIVSGRLLQIATLRIGNANWNGGSPVLTVREIVLQNANNGIV